MIQQTISRLLLLSPVPLLSLLATYFDTDQQMADTADHTPHIIIKIATAARTGAVIWYG